MIVMKFGGASLSTGSEILHTCKIVKNYRKKNKIILVVSAMKNVTDQLFEIVELLRKRNLREALERIEKIKTHHIKALQSFEPDSEAVKTEVEIIKLIGLLKYFVNNAINKEITTARIDYIVSFGEKLSCRIVAEALQQQGISAYPMDASFILATTGEFGNALPLYGKSQNSIKHILLPLIASNIVPVITGYIGFTHDGCTTTLGRGGSDLSATFLANFLDAKAVYLWKDVLGFYQEDPHKNKRAKLFKILDYEHAEKLAKKGAKIIYYKAIAPVAEKHIPIYVKSFLNPHSEGTTITDSL